MDRVLEDGEAESFRGLVLLLRGRIGLTQRELAARLGVHAHSVQAWEAGLSHPGAASMRALVEVTLRAGGFAPGRESAEAEALWTAAAGESSRLRAPFDRAWFDGALAAAGGHPSARLPSDARPPGPDRQHWGEAPDVAAIQGRAPERAQLREWLLDPACRVVAVLGMGGVGKTLLAARAARDVLPAVEAVYWRSLRDAPPPAEWLAGALGFLVPDRPAAATDPALLERLLERLGTARCLLILDNLETVLEPGARTGTYRPGYEDYGRILQALAESPHRSCVLVTSREAFPELGPRHGDTRPTRALPLGGLPVDAVRALLGDRRLAGDAGAWDALVARYAGNGLALKVVAETIGAVFDGDIRAFLKYATLTHGAVFGGVRQLLDAQIGRLSDLERRLLRWLAVEREPVPLIVLAADLEPVAGRGAVLEALEGLRRRSLLEWGEQRSTFTLQSVVLEHLTESLLDEAHAELATGHLDRLVDQPLVKATAADYVRRSQERLLVAPVLERLVAASGSSAEAERRLVALLDRMRGERQAEQGYAPGNLVNLLRLLRGHLRGVDLSRLRIRQAVLQEVEAQGASLAGAHLSEAVLADAFSYPTCVALSADGSRLAAGTTTGEVCVWRVADRALAATLRGHQGLVRSVALSRDGRLAASSSEDGTVRLWAVEGDAVGRPLGTLAGSPEGVRGVALSADGRLVAAGGHGGGVRVWRVDGGGVVAELPAQASGVRAVALSADGALGASGVVDGTLHLWSLDADGPRAAPRSPLAGPARGVSSTVALSGDGRLVASGGEERIGVWDAATGRPLATLEGHTAAVWSVALSGDGHLLASASFDGTVKLWNPASGRLDATLLGHVGGVRDVALSAGGELAASCSFDGTVRLWETELGRPLATIRGHTSGARGMALSADGRLVASGGYDGVVRLWDAATGRLLREMRGHGAGVWTVALTSDGRLAASGSFDGTIKLWETNTGALVTTLQGEINQVWGVALSPDGAVVASGSYGGTMRLWETATGRLAATLEGHVGGVWGVALGGGRPVAASGGEDGSVKLWDALGGRLRKTLRGHTGGVWNVAVSGDGRRVASGGEDGAAMAWDAATGRLLSTLRGHAGGVWSVALSADGRLAASGSFDGLIRLWDPETGRVLATLEGHAGAVWSVALSGDRRLIASGGFDGTLRLWAVGTGATTGAGLRTLRVERRYERMDITGLTGITGAQRDALIALGAVDEGPSPTLV